MQKTHNVAKKIASGGFAALVALSAIVLVAPSALASDYTDCGAGFNPEWSTLPPATTQIDLASTVLPVAFSMYAFNPQGTGLPHHNIHADASAHILPPGWVSISSPTPANPNQVDVLLSPTAADNGVYTFYAHADDFEGCDAFAAFTVIVADCGGADAIDPMGAGSPADFTMNVRRPSGYWGGQFGTTFLESGFSGSSPDGNAVALSLSGAPSFASMTDGGSGTATTLWSPAANSNLNIGVFTMDFVVDDLVTGCSGSESFTVTVVNSVIRDIEASIPSLAAIYWSSPGVAFTVKVKVDNLGTDTQTAALSGIGLPSGWTLSGSGSAAGDGGSSLITATITPDGATTVANINVKATVTGESDITPQTINALIPIVVDLVLDFDLYFPDEDVAGTVTATYLNGAPVAGKDLSVGNRAQIAAASDPIIVGATDAAGSFAFLFPSNLMGATSLGHHKVTAAVSHSGFDWLDVFEYDVLIDARLQSLI